MLFVSSGEKYGLRKILVLIFFIVLEVVGVIFDVIFFLWYLDGSIFMLIYFEYFFLFFLEICMFFIIVDVNGLFLNVYSCM